MSSEQKVMAELRSAMLAEVKPADMAAIMRKMIELAKEGSLQAAKLVLSYTLGKPEPSVRVEVAETVAKKPVATVLPEPLKEFLAGSPSANGVLDELRERRLTAPAGAKDAVGRKK